MTIAHRLLGGRHGICSVVGFVFLALFSGCAGQMLKHRVRTTRDVLHKAREAGAYECAPRHLAMGDVHVEFAENELDQGDYFRARAHVEIAEQNAAEARRRTGRCMKEPAEPEPVETPVLAKPSDSDGDGLLDGVDKCIVEPEDKDQFEDDDGCPDPDNDSDSIADKSDICPMDPEDLDKFEDEDGCPEKDNDKDGIEDARDRCPAEPEDADGFEDEDGCPDRDNDADTIDDTADKCPNEPGPVATGGCPQQFKLIEVKGDKIELLQKIFFDTAKATIQPRSFALLDEVAEVFRARPTLRVRIEGHTDSRGKRPLNVRLSQARADSVRARLIGLGITGDRMESVGFGPDQPIETNRTAAGRERNRRVEFVITNQ